MNKYIILIIVVFFAFFGIYIFYKQGNVSTASKSGSVASTTISVKFVSSTITASGTVTAQNQVKLNFQTGGKLIYMPFKEGDKVNAGQTVARLDTYALQRQLTAALNTYRSTRDTFEQAQENSQDNIQKTQISPTYSTVNGIDTTTAVNDAIKRIADQNQATLDNSVVNVELANYALQLSTLTSPLRGIITHEDVTTSGINITPATSFTVADPNSIIFRTNIPSSNIYYVSEGNTVEIAIDGIPDKLAGIVSKIYPSKIVLPDGEAVYQADIQSDGLEKYAKLDQTGVAIISTNSENVALVPAWTVLSGKYIWIDNSGTPELKQITSGKIHGNEIEITSGLSANDKIIIDPKYIPSQKYQVL